MSDAQRLSPGGVLQVEGRGGSAPPPATVAHRLAHYDVVAAVAALVFALGGFGVGLYLAVVHYTHQQIACRGIGECEYVNSSKYAELAGVPVALLGAFAYASVALLLIAWRLLRVENALLAAWGIALASFAFSAYLTYIELFVIDAICVYCVVSAAMATAMFASLSGVVWLRTRE
jgi:uncharacterized membrane protein